MNLRSDGSTASQYGGEGIPKSENRNPKPEGNPKPEQAYGKWFRISDFIRASGFGLRISFVFLGEKNFRRRSSTMRMKRLGPDQDEFKFSRYSRSGSQSQRKIALLHFGFRGACRVAPLEVNPMKGLD
jgi:hypothetical protein